jgi:ketosteroid isomerase-like protein
VDERGVEAFIEALDPNVEFHPPKESMNPGVYRGHEGVRDYFGRLSEVVEDQRVESVDVIDVDKDRVIATVRAFGRFAHFEQEVELRWSYLIAVQDGKAIHVRTFTDQRQALEAAGLSE